MPKNNDSPKIVKKERGKSETISRGAHIERHWGYVCVCVFSMVTSIVLIGDEKISKK